MMKEPPIRIEDVLNGKYRFVEGQPVRRSYVDMENIGIENMKYKVGDEVRIKGTDIGGPIESIIRGQLIINNGSSKMVEWPENVNATKIVLEKKKKEYPKTYEECCAELNNYPLENGVDGYKFELLSTFQNLIICRDAYWKIAGEEMGLNRPWKPDYDSGVNKYGIICLNGVVQESNPTTNWERHLNKVLDFPTAEMRDAFKENFDPDIEICKEFL